MPGARMGHWTLLSEPMKVGRDYKVDCECRCGTRKQVSAISLRNGHSKHCGCVVKTPRPGQYVSEGSQCSAEVLEELELVSHGYLPLADQFRISDGAPTWTLSSLAQVLGISRSELVSHLYRGGARFNGEIKSQLMV